MTSLKALIKLVVLSFFFFGNQILRMSAKINLWIFMCMHHTNVGFNKELGMSPARRNSKQSVTGELQVYRNFAHCIITTALKMAPTPSFNAKKIEKSARNRPIKMETVPKEKRAKRHKSRPTADVLSRIYRALSQRMYLIDQKDISSDADGLGREFTVLGTTGNVYTVNICRLPTCNCPDFARGKLCKHIIFALARVLQVPRNSELMLTC